jgi:hypothetical protein
MALSPGSVEAGKWLWGIRLPRGISSSGDLQRVPITVFEAEAPINPRTLTAPAFQGLTGYRQEAVLLSLLGESVIEKVAELRPDFNANLPPSREELAVSFLVGELIRRDLPITPSSDVMPNSMFDQIYALCYPVGRDELVVMLERERQRAQKEFPEAFFAPAEDIGPFCAARRYFANLVMALGKETRYTREFFEPRDPALDGITPFSEGQKERYRRAQAAYNARLQETALLGVPWS